MQGKYIKISAIVVLLAAAGFLFWRQFRPPQVTNPEVYFFNLEEKSLFEVPKDRVPPIKDGIGVRAHVYACGSKDAETFVGYLEKFTSEGKSVRENAIGVPLETLIRSGKLAPEDHLVAHPDHPDKWYPSSSRKGREIKSRPARQCGNQKPIRVTP
ncbi:MAG: hypothetical protein ACLFWL_05980 [Candidatus Brocadiia bacterium]